MEESPNTVFPKSPRVIYGKNSLVEVICQLQFPTILRIEAEVPAEFQERIRKDYPTYKEKTLPEIPPNMPDEFAKMMVTGSRGHDFISADGYWTVALTKDFLALSTTRYERWEVFRDRLSHLHQLLVEVYAPAYFTRVGLRYHNSVRRSVLGLDDVSWRHLLKGHILGELSEPTVENLIRHARKVVAIDLGNESRVQIRHGLGQTNENEEVVYVIDADYFTTERTEIDNAIARLDQFNHESGHLFRWCITSQLHDAMEPSSVE